MSGSALNPASRPPKTKEKSAALTAAQRDQAVAELRYQTAFYLEAVQALSEGIVLGAEQVQDKRIELLEAGPTIDPTAVVITVVLTLILEGTVGPPVASVMTRMLLQPVMRNIGKAINRQRLADIGPLRYNARLYRSMARGTRANQDAAGIWSQSEQATRELEDLARKLDAQAAVLQSDLRGRLGAAQETRKLLNGITRFVEGNLVAAAKVPTAVASNVPGTTTPLTAGGSPAVEIMAAAMASASRLRLTVSAAHEALEAHLRHPDTDAQAIGEILDGYRVEGECDLAVLRSTYQTAAEAMIWAALLVTEPIRNAVALLDTPIAPGDRGRPYGAAAAGLNVDPKLEAYLLLRFNKEVARWALENDVMPISELRRTGSPHNVPPRPTGWWEQLPAPDRADLLTRYLTAVANGTPKQDLMLRI